MRTWVYSYTTSDGLRHEGEMGAPDKDSVYAELRRQGIRPIKVTERIVPVVRKGFKGLRKRDISCIVLCAVCLAGVVWYFAASITNHQPPTTDHQPPTTNHQPLNTLSPLPRHQIKGFETIDPAAVFANPSEAYLVRYAQPGFVSAETGARSAEVIEDLIANLKTPMKAVDGDSAAVIELKRTVLGVKNEVALLLAGGRGINDILVWLDERQKMEAEHRERIAANVRRGVTKKDEANQLLRRMELKIVE